VVTLDADGQHDPADIPLLVETLRGTGADLVVGSREAGFAEMSRGRRFGNRFSSRALEFFSGLRLPDTQSGYRVYSMRFVREVELRSDAYDAEMALLLEAGFRRLRVVSVPIRVPRPDGRSFSHFRPWVDTYRICRTVIFLALRRFGGRRG
jgi:glycosyltransferase involved in cell wall biosynthesis